MIHGVAGMSKPCEDLSQNMPQVAWLPKSAVARIERINRRTVQRTCRTWESLPGTRDYLVTDSKGRVNLEGFRRFRSFTKQIERRGFPVGKKRAATGPWRELMKRLKDQKSFGKTYEEKINLIRSEIESMTDTEQGVFLWDAGTFCRQAARDYVVAFAKTVRQYQQQAG